MNAPILLGGLTVLLLLAGCETRSISASGYRSSYGWHRNDSPSYRGELTEIDILGSARDGLDDDPAKALTEATPPLPRIGDRIVLIQSGAGMPDNAMIDAAAARFAIAPFSGVPREASAIDTAQTLRLHAARGGCRYIVCYWGVLESARVDQETKAISWVPIAGAWLNDEKQQMRIRLKALVVDVTTGNWRMLAPTAISDAKSSARATRERVDQALVEKLKTQAYQQLIEQLST